MSASAIDYLRIPDEYGRKLGGLRLAESGDAIEFVGGGTFALAPEIGLFVSGFAGRARLIHFAYMLHALTWLGRSSGEIGPPFDALRRTFVATGRRYRNAGALFAHLCERIPRTATTIDADEVARVLTRSVSAMAEIAFAEADTDSGEDDDDLAPEPAPGEHLKALLRALESVARNRELPPIGYASFEIHVRDELAKIAAPTLECWLKHGEPVPKSTGETIAREILAEKPSLADVLARVSERPRLGGAASLLTQLASALVIPPRRLAASELPLGGYADIATRGHPEQILPSQLALDSMEFVRRFAENELLYYRREEPHARIREELVVVVDQGARTWGTVRLVLAAAALALGRLAARKKVRCFFASTGNEGALLDPIEDELAPGERALGEKELGDLLEASDLTLEPARALEKVLEEPTEAARDVVLLTHPRTLSSEDVLAAARRAQKPVRLFGVLADDSGAVELAEIRHGSPVTVSRFRVELASPESREPKPGAASRVTDPAAWKGDVESVPFPFLFGPTGQLGLRSFDFDPTGSWLLIAGRKGLLFAHKTDGTRAEVWPRGVFRETPISDVDVVRGVNGGFVVLGRVRDEIVVAHYDLVARSCRVHLLGKECPRPFDIFYYQDLHAIAVRLAQAEKDSFRALDLGTSDKSFGKSMADIPGERETRALKARRRAMESKSLPDPELRVFDRKPSEKEFYEQNHVFVDKAGTVGVDDLKTFMPLADGKPVLQGVKVLAAKYRGGVLALATHEHPKLPAGFRRVARNMLRLFRKDGTVLGEYEQVSDNAGFQLSHDGSLVARDTGKAKLEVRKVTGGAPTLVTAPGRFHNQIELVLGDRWLAVEVPARLVHMVRWDGDELLSYTISYRPGNPTTLEAIVARELSGVAVREPGQRATRWRLPEWVQSDPGRWVTAAHADVVGVTDRYGHVALYDREKKLAALLFVWRKEIAVWLPDGTRSGSPRLTGTPPSPDARRKIAQALKAATARGKALQT